MNPTTEQSKDMSQLIMDLVGFSLEQAGFNQRAYGFELHIAFRHQKIINKESFHQLCDLLEQKKEIEAFLDDPRCKKILENFSQKVIDEINVAEDENLAIKLIKNSYLSHLDRARNSSAQAIRTLTLIEDNSQSVSSLEATGEAIPLVNLLKAQINHLDALSYLPFALEKFCLKIASNYGINYQPMKTAEMLSQVLDTISLACGPEGLVKDSLLNGLKLAIRLSMPDLPLDSQFVDHISGELLPFIDDLIKKDQAYHQYKIALMSDEKAEARQTLLASMDVRLTSIENILDETLIRPVQAMNQPLLQLFALGEELREVAQQDNRIDQINIAYQYFDKMASVIDQVPESLELPAWIRQGNQHYQDMKAPVQEVIYHGLGAFYDYALSFIPEAVKYYFSGSDALNAVLLQVDDKPNHFKPGITLAYISFYELWLNADIGESLKAIFFESYMQEVIKADSIRFKADLINFEAYQCLERQWNKKPSFAPNISLAERVTQDSGFLDENIVTRSLLDALDTINMDSPKKFNVLLLIHRLQTLESRFNPDSAEVIFDELLQAHSILMNRPKPVNQAFRERFLEPALQRMLEKYQKNHLCPNLAVQIDSQEDLALRKIYTAFNHSEGLSEVSWQVLKSKQPGLSESMVEQLKQIHKILELSPNPQRLKDKTAKEAAKEAARLSYETAKPLIENAIDRLHDNLSDQKLVCTKLKKIAQEDSELYQLALEKEAYIDAVLGVVNQMVNALNTPAFQTLITQLLAGEASEAMLSAKNDFNQFSVTDTHQKFMQFAMRLIPATVNSGSKSINRTVLENIFIFFLCNNNLSQLILKRDAYYQQLNASPAIAWIGQLHDPLSMENILPSQEKIMDVIIDNLLEKSKDSLMGWGIDYLKHYAGQITYEGLQAALPYPFLANIAYQTLTSETVQARLRPVFNGLINQCNFGADRAKDLLKAQAKEKLYPLLGIEIQRQLEENACRYAENPQSASETDLDACLLFYFQYRSYKQYAPGIEPNSIMEIILPELEQELQNSLLTQFEKFEELYIIDAPNNPLEKFKTELAFLIQAVDLSHPKMDDFVKLALINRLIIIALNSAEQLSDQKAITLWQAAAIEQFSQLLQAKQKKLLIGDEPPALSPAPQSMMQILKPSHQRLQLLQLQKLQAALQPDFLNQEIHKNEEMLKTPSLPGQTVLHWRYQQATPERKLYKFILGLWEVVSFIIAWSAVIAPILSGTGVLSTILFTLGLGSAFSGIGLIILAQAFLICFGVKLVKEIWQNRAEFARLEKEPFLTKIGRAGLLILQCAGFSLAKTLLSEPAVAKITQLFAISRIARIRNAFRVWPTAERLNEEKTALEALRDELNLLSDLLNTQMQYIQTQEGIDCTEHIQNKLESIQEKRRKIAEVYQNPSVNDARFSEDNFQETLDKLDAQLTGLDTAIQSMQTWLNAQAAHPALVAEEAAIQPSEKEENAVIIPIQTKEKKQPCVALDAYCQHREILDKPDKSGASEKEEAVNSQWHFPHLSHFWPGQRYEKHPEEVNEALLTSVAALDSFVLL